MAQFPINVPDDLVAEMLDAFAWEGGYYGDGIKKPSKLTKADFAKEMVRDYPKDVLKRYRAFLRENSAHDLDESARATDIADVDRITVE